MEMDNNNDDNFHPLPGTNDNHNQNPITHSDTTYDDILGNRIDPQNDGAINIEVQSLSQEHKNVNHEKMKQND